MARIRYGLVDFSGMAWTLLAHYLLGRSERVDERGAAEEALGVLRERRRLLRELDAVVVEPPQERRNRDVEHREFVAEHVLLLGEHRRDLGEVVADDRPRLLGLLLRAFLDRHDVAEHLLLEPEEEKTGAGAHHRV